jgi:hypothetical protein
MTVRRVFFYDMRLRTVGDGTRWIPYLPTVVALLLPRGIL